MLKSKHFGFSLLFAAVLTLSSTLAVNAGSAISSSPVDLSPGQNGATPMTKKQRSCFSHCDSAFGDNQDQWFDCNYYCLMN